MASCSLIQPDEPFFMPLPYCAKLIDAQETSVDLHLHLV